MRRFFAIAVIASMPLAAPAAAYAGGGGCHGTYTPDAKGVQVRIHEACMDPLVIRVAKNGTVEWTNDDGLAHNIVGSAYLWGSNVDLSRGESVAFRFDDDGVYPYVCSIHPGMSGAVVVGSGVRAADLATTTSSVTKVASRRSAPVVASSAARSTVQPSTEAAPEPLSSAAAVAAPAPAPTPPSAQPQSVAVGRVPSRSSDNGRLVLAGFTLAGLLVLAGIAWFARRTPNVRELVG